jgi:hypothetical protein
MKCCSSSRRCPGHNRSADERDRRRRRFRHSVLGAGVQNPADALSITRRALELGFETTVGVIHDHGGQLLPLQGKEKTVYDQIQSERKPAFWAFAYDKLFHKNLALGQPNDWQCRAGSRYLYICEDGLFTGVPSNGDTLRSRWSSTQTRTLRSILHDFMCTPGCDDRSRSGKDA